MLCGSASPAGRTLGLQQSSKIVTALPLDFLFPSEKNFLPLLTSFHACGSPRLWVLDCNPFFFPNKSFLGQIPSQLFVYNQNWEYEYGLGTYLDDVKIY